MDKHAIVVADKSGIIRLWNAGATNLFGYSADEAVGQTLDLIGADDYREHHWTGFRRARETGTAASEGQSTHIPVRCRDGQVVPFPGLFMLLRDAQKTVIGAMAIFSPPS